MLSGCCCARNRSSIVRPSSRMRRFCSILPRKMCMFTIFSDTSDSRERSRLQISFCQRMELLTFHFAQFNSVLLRTFLPFSSILLQIDYSAVTFAECVLWFYVLDCESWAKDDNVLEELRPRCSTTSKENKYCQREASTAALGLGRDVRTIQVRL